MRRRLPPRTGRLGILAAAGTLMIACGTAGRPALTGEVVDAASGGPVYGARVSYGGRSVWLFTSKRFSLRLPKAPGISEGVLRVTAPGYAPFETTLAARATREVKVALRGVQVPNLEGILVWAELRGESLEMSVRLVDRDGAAIAHFPLLPMSARVRLWVNTGSETAPARGALLYDGAVEVRYEEAGGLEKLRSSLPISLLRAQREGPPRARLAVLEYSLSTPQGDYSWTRSDVALMEASGGDR